MKIFVLNNDNDISKDIKLLQAKYKDAEIIKTFKLDIRDFYKTLIDSDLVYVCEDYNGETNLLKNIVEELSIHVLYFFELFSEDNKCFYIYDILRHSNFSDSCNFSIGESIKDNYKYCPKCGKEIKYFKTNLLWT